MPLFRAKKEVFEWIKQGHKTIDIRKGKPQRGEVAVFLSGPYSVRLKIVKKETGRLCDVVRADNFKCIIPIASNVGDAIAYLSNIYPDATGVFTAYYING